VRAEGLTDAHAAALAAAGFTKLEIGLQSVSPETLRRSRRGGSAARVADATRRLRDAGIELLVDLIVGLPGDGPEEIADGIEFLLEHDLADAAQVFPLAVLPGTPMRETAERDGLVFDPRPPYRIRRTAWLDEGALARALGVA